MNLLELAQAAKTDLVRRDELRERLNLSVQENMRGTDKASERDQLIFDAHSALKRGDLNLTEHYIRLLVSPKWSREMDCEAAYLVAMAEKHRKGQAA